MDLLVRDLIRAVDQTQQALPAIKDLISRLSDQEIKDLVVSEFVKRQIVHTADSLDQSFHEGMSEYEGEWPDFDFEADPPVGVPWTDEIWEHGVNKFLKNHPDFFNETMIKGGFEFGPEYNGWLVSVTRCEMPIEGYIFTKIAQIPEVNS